MYSNVYLARQPILDKMGNLFAYELLFRDSPENETALIRGGMSATANVLENAMNGIGLTALLGSQKGFVNCSREMLLGNIPSLLDPKKFVLEILENVVPDDEVVYAISNLKLRGFEIALDDFLFSKENCEIYAPLFPYLSYVKLDIVANSIEQRKEAVVFFKEKEILLLAEKVETELVFKECLENGFDFFQGFFFAKPEVLTGQFLPAKTQGILELIRILRKEPSIEKLCIELERYPEIAESLDRYVETSHIFQNSEKRSYREIIEWVGIRRVQEWLMLLLYSRSSFDGETKNTALFCNVSHRAKFMENIAMNMSDSDGNFCADAFLVGVLSRLEALSCVSLTSAIPELYLPENIRESLEYKGDLGTILRLTEAVEQDSAEEISLCLQQLSLKPSVLKFCLENAYTWAAYA